MTTHTHGTAPVGGPVGAPAAGPGGPDARSGSSRPVPAMRGTERRARRPVQCGGGLRDDPRRALGAWGEGLAAGYLLGQGWQILARNWRCEHGEIDILARDGIDLVIVEVKTRRTTEFGDPLEQVTRKKAARLRRLALAAAREFGTEHRGLRVDLIGVLHRPHSPAQVRHVRAVGS